MPETGNLFEMHKKSNSEFFGNMTDAEQTIDHTEEQDQKLSDVVDNTQSRRSVRERKSVDRMQATETGSKAKPIHVQDGSGVALGEYEFFNAHLEKAKSDDDSIKFLHSFLFHSLGTKQERKKNIRKFCGFSEGANLQEMAEKIFERRSVTVAVLKVKVRYISIFN